MTSTPTACPKCGRLPDFCDHREIVATQLAEPRQPDMSAARDAAAEILGYHGCSSGDCPHEKQSECFAALVEAGYDAGHARALKEMGAEVERVTSERDGWHEDLLVASKQVADMEEQLAAAQNVIDELELNESKMNGALSAKQEQLAACELRAGEYEKALENIPSQDGISWSIARKVLKAHRRGGES